MWSRAKVALFVMLVVLASQAANAKTLRWSGKGDVTSMDPYAFYTDRQLGIPQSYLRAARQARPQSRVRACSRNLVEVLATNRQSGGSTCAET